MPPRSREEIQLRNNLWAPRGGTSASSRAHPTTASFNESGANGSGHHSEHRDSPHPAKRHPSGGGGTGGGRQDGTAALPLPAASRAHSCTLQPSAHPDAKPGAGLHRTAAQTPRSHLPKGLRLIAHRPDRASTSVSSGQREGLKGSAARSAEPTGDRQQPRQPPHTHRHAHTRHEPPGAHRPQVLPAAAAVPPTPRPPRGALLAAAPTRRAAPPPLRDGTAAGSPQPPPPSFHPSLPPNGPNFAHKRSPRSAAPL